MQLTSLSLALTRAGFLSFSPASLFAAGEPGVFFDPSDMSTMFQDSAGTTPVTAVEQPVGLILDKSKGLVLGPELVTNGDFSGGSTGWGVGANWSVSGGLASHAAGAAGELSQLLTIKSGMGYRLTFTISNLTAGSGYIQFAAGGFQSLCSFSANGTYTITVTANSAYTRVGVVALSAASFSVDNISVRELPGNHATQTTATSRPVLSARYNLLTKTEQFDDAVWAKTNATVTANAVAAPNGAQTAEKLVEDSTDAGHRVSSTTVTIPAVAHTITVYAKAAERSILFIRSNLSGVDLNNYFDLSSGTVGTLASGYTGTITNVGDGWYKCSVTAQGSAGARYVGIGCSIANNTFSYTGDGTSGIYIWGASLVPANQANLPYQRVNTATDYDADPSKFKPYLRFDGIDDWLVTPTITPGTDKAQVFAGVRKLSDAAIGVVAEFSVSSGSNSGSFGVYAPGSISAAIDDFGATLNGSAFTGGRFNGYDAPTTRVISSLFDISQATAATEITFRANGSSVPSDGVGSLAANAGAGNFLAYPLYIGRRAGTSLPFNGHIYGMIVRFGSNLPAATIASTESWVAGKTGITL